MANVCIIHKLTREIVMKNRDFVPRMGEKVGCFNISPPPVVVHVLNYPSDSVLAEVGITGDCDVIVLAD